MYTKQIMCLVLSINFLQHTFPSINLTSLQQFSSTDIGKAAQNPSNNYFGSYNNFYTRNNTKIVAQIGSVAVLPCTVRLTSSATVSWIRKKDYQLLTVGLSTYSSDERFIVEHTRHMGLWALRIKNVREEDKGDLSLQVFVSKTDNVFSLPRTVRMHTDDSSAWINICWVESSW